MSKNCSARSSVLLLFAAVLAHAHIPLTQNIIDDAIEEIAEAQALADGATETARKADAIYALATSATALTELLNQEIRLHGADQQQLLEATVARAAELDVEIVWSQDLERFYYTGAAYEQFLELQPDGLNAANSRFYLIETSFYHGDAGNRDAIVARTIMAREYLESYAETANAEHVVMFLAVDYRDLWRLCRAAADTDCAECYATRTRKHLDAVIARYANSKTGEMARTLLTRFETESANPD